MIPDWSEPGGITFWGTALMLAFLLGAVVA